MTNDQTIKKGFTLIELLITVALITITIGLTTDIILTVTRSYNKTQITNEIEENANFALSKLEKELRTAISATPISGDGEPSFTFTNKSGVLVTYSVNNGTLYRKVGTAGSLVEMTNTSNTNGVKVECINGSNCFEQIGSDPYTLKLNWKLTQKTSSTNKIFQGEYTINNTFVIRGTY